MDNIENNLFKVILIGVLSMGILTILPAKTYEKNIKPTVLLSQNEKPIPQVIIVGKRIPKEQQLFAAR